MGFLAVDINTLNLKLLKPERDLGLGADPMQDSYVAIGGLGCARTFHGVFSFLIRQWKIEKTVFFFPAESLQDLFEFSAIAAERSSIGAIAVFIRWKFAG